MKKVSLVLVFGLVTALLLTSCSFGMTFGLPIGMSGSGNVVTETRQVSGFNGVVLAAVGKLTITQGDKEKLTITSDDNILPLIKTEVRAGKLVIEFENPSTTISSLTEITYNLTVVNLNSLQISGAGDITAAGLKSESFTASVSGAGNIEVSGEAVTQVVTVSGAGDYLAADLKSQSVKVTITGVGGATVWVQKDLDATISGLGTVSYYGNPVVTKRITGAGSVDAKGDK